MERSVFENLAPGQRNLRFCGFLTPPKGAHVAKIGSKNQFFQNYSKLMGLQRTHILGINEAHRRPQLLDMAPGGQSLVGPVWGQNMGFLSPPPGQNRVKKSIFFKITQN